LEDLERLAAQQQVGGAEHALHDLARLGPPARERRRPAAVGEVAARVLVRPARRLDDAVQADELLYGDLAHGGWYPRSMSLRGRVEAAGAVRCRLRRDGRLRSGEGPRRCNHGSAHGSSPTLVGRRDDIWEVGYICGTHVCAVGPQGRTWETCSTCGTLRT